MAGDIELDNLQAPLQGSPEPPPPSRRGKWVVLGGCCFVTLVLSIILFYSLLRRSPPPESIDGKAVPINLTVTSTATTTTTTTTTFFAPDWPAQVAVGSLLTTIDGTVAPCTDMWDFTCGTHFSERSRLSVVQQTVDVTLDRILPGLPDPIPSAYAACQSTPPLVLNYQTALDLWSFGFEVNGLFVSATSNSFEKFKPIRLFITTTMQRRGPSVFLPYDLLDCPGPLGAMLDDPSTPPAIRTLLSGPVYSDYTSIVCKKLSSMNVTDPTHTITTDVSRRCGRLIASAYASVAAPAFLAAMPPTHYTIKVIFEGAVSALLAKLPSSWPSRFRAKLRTLGLHIGPTTFSIPDAPTLSGNMTNFYYAGLRSKWHYELSTGDAPTYMFPWDVNAFYSPDTNAVTIPTAMASLWSPSLPFSAYATTVGFVVAHEVSHSIDPFGIHFDEVGTYSPLPLPASYHAFVDCLLGDASQSGLHPNQTIGEIFADRVGMEAANALVNFSHGNYLNLYGARTISPGEFAFMLFVRSWCDSPQTEQGASLNYTIENDPHPPNQFRIRETLRGLPAFNSIFDCSRAGCPLFGVADAGIV